MVINLFRTDMCSCAPRWSRNAYNEQWGERRRKINKTQRAQLSDEPIMHYVVNVRDYKVLPKLAMMLFVKFTQFFFANAYGTYM